MRGEPSAQGSHSEARVAGGYRPDQAFVTESAYVSLGCSDHGDCGSVAAPVFFESTLKGIDTAVLGLLDSFQSISECIDTLDGEHGYVTSQVQLHLLRGFQPCPQREVF